MQQPHHHFAPGAPLPPGKAPYGAPAPGMYPPSGPPGAPPQPGMLQQPGPPGGPAANGFGPPRPMGPPGGAPRPLMGGPPPPGGAQHLAAGMQHMNLGPPQGPPGGPRPMGAPPMGPPPGAIPSAHAPQPGAMPHAHAPGHPQPPGPRPMGPPGGAVPVHSPTAAGARPLGPPMGPPGGMGGPPPPQMANGPQSGRGPMPGFMPPGPPGGARPVGPPGAYAPRPMGPPGAAGPPPPGTHCPGAPPGPPGARGPYPGPPPPPGAFPGAPPGPPGALPGAPPPPPPGAGHAAPRQQGMQSRIDPSQIPRPTVAHTGPEPIIFHTRANGAHQNPPPSTSHYIVRDCGSASPRLLRSSLNAVPHTPELLASSGMPLAVVVQPLGLPDPRDDPVPVVDLGELGPLRCGRCKAYVNAFCRWTDGGKAFGCCFCGHANPCPEPYFCYLGPDGRRRDADERPELSRGTYEIVATRDYMVRPPMAVTHVFAVDVSGPALASGATAAACQCIEQVLDSIQGGDAALVGVVTFDSSVHFYGVAPGQQQPSMMVVADTADVYSPMPAAGLARLAECKEQLVDLLHSIPGMFNASAHGPESCGAAAIEACVQLLKPTGGKVHAFLASLPNSGARALKIRDHSAALNEKDKQTALLPQDNTYYTIAQVAADHQVALDVFLLVQSHADAATLGVLCSTTGGSLYRYSPFAPAADQDQLLNDLKWNVARPQGLEAILRVRASAGLDVEGYSGAFYKPPNSPTDVYLPAVDSDKALLARLTVTEKLPAGSECFVQSALLYTSTDGARRIRVSTLALPTTDAMGAVFKGADLDAQLSVMARQVATTLPGSTFAAAKDAVMGRTIATLAAYRRFCATSSSAVQLILPEALKLLPLYALAMLKSPALRPDARADERSVWLGAALCLGAGRVMGLLHGRLYPLHRLVEAGPLPPDGGLPDPMALSSEGLETGGVYVYEDGRDAYVYLDRDAAPGLVQDLFGVASADELARLPQPLSLPPRDAPAASLLRELLTRLRLERCAYMRLRVVRRGDPLEAVFLGQLLEDRSPAGMSYVEFLCHVHRQIQNKMGG